MPRYLPRQAQSVRLREEQTEHLRTELEDSLVKTRGQQAILRSFFAYAKLKL